MEIIKADEAWIDQILAMDKESISPPWTHGQMLSEIYNDCTDFLIAVENGVLIGFSVLRNIGDEAELYRIAVKSGMRHQGIGAKLLRNLIENAKNNGTKNIFLEVRSSNMPAISLYEKFGFSKAGLRRAYYDSPIEDACVMVLEM